MPDKCRLREQSASQQSARIGKDDEAPHRGRFPNSPCGSEVSPKERTGIVLNGVAEDEHEGGERGVPGPRRFLLPSPNAKPANPRLQRTWPSFSGSIVLA